MDSSSDDEYGGDYSYTYTKSTATTGPKSINHGWGIAITYLSVWAVILIILRVLYRRYISARSIKLKNGWMNI